MHSSGSCRKPADKGLGAVGSCLCKSTSSVLTPAATFGCYNCTSAFSGKDLFHESFFQGAQNFFPFFLLTLGDSDLGESYHLMPQTAASRH